MGATLCLEFLVILTFCQAVYPILKPHPFIRSFASPCDNGFMIVRSQIIGKPCMRSPSGTNMGPSPWEMDHWTPPHAIVVHHPEGRYVQIYVPHTSHINFPTHSHPWNIGQESLPPLVSVSIFQRHPITQQPQTRIPQNNHNSIDFNIPSHYPIASNEHGIYRGDLSNENSDVEDTRRTVSQYPIASNEQYPIASNEHSIYGGDLSNENFDVEDTRRTVPPEDNSDIEDISDRQFEPRVENSEENGGDYDLSYLDVPVEVNYDPPNNNKATFKQPPLSDVQTKKLNTYKDLNRQRMFDDCIDKIHKPSSREEYDDPELRQQLFDNCMERVLSTEIGSEELINSIY